MKTDALNLAHSKGRGGHKVGRGMFLRFFDLQPPSTGRACPYFESD